MTNVMFIHHVQSEINDKFDTLDTQGPEQEIPHFISTSVDNAIDTIRITIASVKGGPIGEVIGTHM